MREKITIELDDSSSALTADALVKLSEQAQFFAVDLLNEAIRIEEGNREDGAKCEITSTIIMRAAHSKKYNNLSQKKIPLWLKITKIISTISILITGFLFDSNGYQNNLSKLIFFIIFLLISSVSTAIIYIKEWY